MAYGVSTNRTLLLLFLLLVVLSALVVPHHRMHCHLVLTSILYTDSLIRITGMQRQEVLATRLLPITPIAQSHLDVVVSRILHDVRCVLQVHMETSQQSLQFRVSHVREGTAVTLLA